MCGLTNFLPEVCRTEGCCALFEWIGGELWCWDTLSCLLAPCWDHQKRWGSCGTHYFCGYVMRGLSKILKNPTRKGLRFRQSGFSCGAVAKSLYVRIVPSMAEVYSLCSKVPVHTYCAEDGGGLQSPCTYVGENVFQVGCVYSDTNAPPTCSPCMHLLNTSTRMYTNYPFCSSWWGLSPFIIGERHCCYDCENDAGFAFPFISATSMVIKYSLLLGWNNLV